MKQKKYMNVENERVNAGWDGRIRLARPNSQARMGKEEKILFPFRLTSRRIGNHTLLIQTIPICSQVMLYFVFTTYAMAQVSTPTYH